MQVVPAVAGWRLYYRPGYGLTCVWGTAETATADARGDHGRIRDHSGRLWTPKSAPPLPRTAPWTPTWVLPPRGHLTALTLRGWKAMTAAQMKALTLAPDAGAPDEARAADCGHGHEHEAGRQMTLGIYDDAS